MFPFLGCATSRRSPMTSTRSSTRATRSASWSRASSTSAAASRDVVVAKVLEVNLIEGADKIRRIVVDHGDGPVQVVCGAWNFEAGATVAFAPVGAVLPGDFAIGKRKMKGVESNGMICSERELELGDDGAGIMLLDDSLAPGTPLADALGIEPDVVLDLAIEGNRPDALCILGVARDLAAKLDLPFTEPAPALELPAPSADGPSSRSSHRRCARSSPRRASTNVDHRSVARVDAAPPHAGGHAADQQRRRHLELRDARARPADAPLRRQRLPGGGFVVRAAEPGEQLLTLDGETRTLGVGGEDCVIADANGVGVGIGGIMGGGTVRDRRHDDQRRPRGGVVRTDGDRPHVEATRPALRSLGALREGCRRRAASTAPSPASASWRSRTPAPPSGPARCGVPRSSRRSPRSSRCARRGVNALLGTDLDADAIDGYLTRHRLRRGRAPTTKRRR